MGQSSATPPQPPGLSPQEQELLAKQNLTLDQFREILNQSSLDSADTQNLLRQLSGLYEKKVTPERRIPGKPTESINQAQINSLIQGLSSNPRIKTITLPDQRSGTMEDLQRALSDINYARDRGLTTASLGAEEVIPASESWALNQKAVDDLRARIVAEEATQTKIKGLTDQRYIKALEGKSPVSVGLLQQRETDFKLLKEGAARRGIIIDGDDPASAVSQSTAGNELVGQFRRTYGLLEDTERRAELSGGAPQIMPSYVNPLNFATNSTGAGPSNLLPTYSNLSQMYAGAGTPYYNQRMLGYQGQVAGYNAGRQQSAVLPGMLGTGAGIAAMAGGPWGYGIAGGLGLMGLGASYL